MRWLTALLLACPLWAAGAPNLYFSRSFPGSVPAYFQLTIESDGNVKYAEAPDEDPLTFSMSETDTGEIFGLVQKLDYLKRPLEKPTKVAFMGAKTIRYENGSEKNEVKFNYTEDLTARELVNWFERMGQSARDRIELERTVKYDKLGVVSALLRLQSDLDNKRLVAPDQFLPLLDRVVNNDSYMHTARERAAAIAAAVRTSKP